MSDKNKRRPPHGIGLPEPEWWVLKDMANRAHDWANYCEARRREFGLGKKSSRPKPEECGLLTQSDVAKLLGLTPVKVSRAVRSGAAVKPVAPAPLPPARYYYAEQLPDLAHQLGVDPGLAAGSVPEIMGRLRD